MAKVSKELLKRWDKLCADIQNATVVAFHETPAQKQERIARVKTDYKYFFEYYFPHYAKSETASFHIEFANIIKNNKKIDAVWEAYRSSAKSVHGTMGVVLWLKICGELDGYLQVSNTQDAAIKLIGAVQAELMYNARFIHDFGKQVGNGNWSDGYFVDKDGISYHALGIGQSPRGVREAEKRPNYINVDDADTQKRCQNERLVKRAVEWILDDLRGCFDASDDSSERLAIVNNRIHKNSILATFLREMPHAYHLKVNATDEDGNPTWAAKTSKEYWIKKKSETPYRSYQREFMNNPIEAGLVFKDEWIVYVEPLELVQYDALVCYGDLSYTAQGDYKAIVLLGKKGKDTTVLDAFVQQTSINNAVKWWYDLEDSFPSNVACTHYFEGNFIQDKFSDDFDAEGDVRGWYLNIVSDKRSKPNKFLRIEKMSGLFERGNIYFSERKKRNNNMKMLIDQILAFEKGSGANDDGPDAVEGGLYYLNRKANTKGFAARFGETISSLAKKIY